MEYDVRCASLKTADRVDNYRINELLVYGRAAINPRLPNAVQGALVYQRASHGVRPSTRARSFLAVTVAIFACPGKALRSLYEGEGALTY